MKKVLIRFFIFTMMASVFPFTATAQTGYVSDSLLLTFREGPGNNYAVIKTLKSNTQVSVLEEQEGYYKVELQTKEIGWVDKKFIVFEMPSYYLLKELEAKNKALQSKLESLDMSNKKFTDKLSSSKEEYDSKIIELKNELEQAKIENSQLLESSENYRKNYEALVEQSKDIMNIIQENKTLQKENQVLAKDFEAFQNKYKNSFRSGMIKWFIAGVVVLLAGWIIGSGVSSKRYSSGSLLD